MKNRKLRTMNEIQKHNRMTSGQRLKHQYGWDFFDWLQDEHQFIAGLLAAVPFIALVLMTIWSLLNPYG